MPSIIPPKLKSFIEGPQGMSLGTRDLNLEPEYCRVLGAEVMENDIVKFFVAKLNSDQTIKNIDDNKLVSITLCSPLSYECYQFKGKCFQYEDSNNEDQGRVEKYMTDFNEYLVKVGTKDGVVYKWPTKPCITIEMKVEEIFDQTPKIGAGNKITG